MKNAHLHIYPKGMCICAFMCRAVLCVKWHLLTGWSVKLVSGY